MPPTDYVDAEQMVAELSGAQIQHGHIDGPGGLYLQLVDGRVFVVVGLPAMGVALIRSEGSLH